MRFRANLRQPLKFYTSAVAGILFSLSLVNAKVFDATGYGETAEAARKDAVTNAVKFSVGEFVVKREELDNESFNQNIVSYSNAYIKRIDVKSQEKQGEQYIVNVEVDIESQKLLDILKERSTFVLKDAVDNSGLNDLLNRFEKEDQYEKSIQDYYSLVDELFRPLEKERKEVLSVNILDKIKPIPEEFFDTWDKKLDYEKFRKKYKKDIFQDVTSGNGTYPLMLGIELIPENGFVDRLKHLINEMKLPKYAPNSESLDIIRYKQYKEHGYIYSDGEKETIWVHRDKYFYFSSLARKWNFYLNTPHIEIEFINSEGNIFKRLDVSSGDSHLGLFPLAGTLQKSNNYIVYPSPDYKSYQGYIVFYLNREEIQSLKDINLRIQYPDF